jgi:hypothetical protein
VSCHKANQTPVKLFYFIFVFDMLSLLMLQLKRWGSTLYLAFTGIFIRRSDYVAVVRVWTLGGRDVSAVEGWEVTSLCGVSD